MQEMFDSACKAKEIISGIKGLCKLFGLLTAVE